MLKNTGIIGRSALTDLILKCFSEVLDHCVALYIDISLIIKGHS